MPEVNSVVAIYDSRSQAEEAVMELQRAGCDMAKISIVGDAKTGRVFMVCDGPWAHLTRGLSSRRATAFRTRRKNRHAPPVNGSHGIPLMPRLRRM
jgi:hypothetical protein